MIAFYNGNYGQTRRSLLGRDVSPIKGFRQRKMTGCTHSTVLPSQSWSEANSPSEKVLLVKGQVQSLFLLHGNLRSPLLVETNDGAVGDFYPLSEYGEISRCLRMRGNGYFQ